jgi:hypothetical protein
MELKLYELVLSKASTSRDIQNLIKSFYDPIEDDQRKTQKCINKDFQHIQSVKLGNLNKFIVNVGRDDLTVDIENSLLFPKVSQMLEYLNEDSQSDSDYDSEIDYESYYKYDSD